MSLSQIEQSVQTLLWEVKNGWDVDLANRCNALDTLIQQRIQQIFGLEFPSEMEAQRLFEISDIIKSLQQRVPNQLPYQMPAFPQNIQPVVHQTITVELIRETFYNAVVPALTSINGMNLITDEDIESFWDWVMDGLPALAIYTAVELSHGYDGIVLVGEDNVVNMNNCPDAFKPLLPSLLQIKESVRKFTNKNNRNAEENIRAIKIQCIANPEIQLEMNTPDYREIMALVAMIRSLAGKVIVQKTFRETAMSAFAVCKIYADEKKQEDAV